MRCLDFTQCPRHSVSCWVHNCSTKGAKVVKIRVRTNNAQADNRKTLDQDLEWSHANTPYKTLLQVIADIVDSAVSGNDSFLSIGTTRDKSSICLMVQVAGARDTVYADTLRTLDEHAQSLL